MSFKDIKGQPKAIKILESYLESGKVPGAFLFCGQEGVGKYSTAISFAKTLNCLESRFDACGACPSCVKISKKEHPDVHEICAQDSDDIKIDQIRELKRSINLRAYEGKKKVFILNDAHRLNPESSNALLKVLEEPPRDSLIILVTSKPQLLFKTIISRCQTIRFYPLNRDYLQDVLVKDYAVSCEQAHYLAYSCEGRLGSALKSKENDILFFKNRVIDGFLFSKDPRAIDELASQDRNEISRQINILSGWFRDISLAKIGIPDSEWINADRKIDIQRLMNQYSHMDVAQIFNSLVKSLSYLESNINTRLLLSNLRMEIWKE